MRRWREAVVGSTRLVSERPELWLPGALAWMASVGWIPFIVAVARPPSVAELTFLGARIVSSGSWPWNAVLIGSAIVAVGLLAFVLNAIANTTLFALLGGRPASRADAARVLAVNLVTALPAALTVLVILLATVVIAPREFNAPDPAGGPVLRTIVRLTPYLVLLALTAAAGGAIAAVAGRLAVRNREGISRALRSAPAMTLGAAPAAHAVVAFVLQLVFVGFTTLLLVVLWAPIGTRLDGGGEIEIGIGLLLVGFVAIWLCLVLAGGALHAWSAATWSRLVVTHPSGRT
ncbi:MAG: hypothetical protein ABIZ57_03290 [Candidatus Limnocylindria bacterium]